MSGADQAVIGGYFIHAWIYIYIIDASGRGKEILKSSRDKKCKARTLQGRGGGRQEKGKHGVHLAKTGRADQNKAPYRREGYREKKKQKERERENDTIPL